MGCSFSSPFGAENATGDRFAGQKKVDHPQKELAKNKRGWNWDSAASANNQEASLKGSK